MTAARNEAAATKLEHEVEFTRVFDAPRAMVWKAWTDPKQLAQWWGPTGFTSPRCDLDLRRGGEIRIDMRAPNGVVYPMGGAFREIVEPERLVFTSAALDANGKPLFENLNTVTFTESNGKTTMKVHAKVIMATPEAAPYLGGMREGWSLSLERLIELLRQGSAQESDREIVTTRVFDAPRELVWKAFTDPEHLPRWWGPMGFTNTTHTFDLKVGGQWRYVMHGPDGRDYENVITYQEIKAPERLTYKQGGDKDCEPVNFSVTVTFEKEGGSMNKTRVTMRAVFPTAVAREFVITKYNAVEGGKQHFTRLGEYLRQMGGMSQSQPEATDPPFVMTRVFNAPRDLVFKVWTEREHLMKWFGPKGVTIPSGKLHLCVGGIFHYAMKTADGTVMWGKWVFREIAPPERLVFIISFSDEQGGLTRHPGSEDWPREILSVVTFAEHAGVSKGTVVTVKWSALNPTASERRTFNSGHASMTQGWSGTMDQLTEYLGTAQS